MKYSKAFLFMTVFVLSANLTFAQLNPIPAESGISGYIGPGGGIVNYKGNMIAGIDRVNFDFGDEIATTLTGEAEEKTLGIGLLNFELGYNFANSRTRIFLGSTLEDFIQFDYGNQLGVRQEIGSFGILSAGLLFSATPMLVWEDPYIINTPREDTQRDSTGARLVWGKILSTGLQLQFDFRTNDIDEEKSGASLGLTDAQRKQLDRNGNMVKGKLQYSYRFAGRHVLAPALTYAVNDRDGDAMSNNAYNLQMTYLYFGDTFIFTGNAMFGKADYDEANPIPDFNNQTQEDDRYGVTASVFYKNPFGWNWFGSDRISFYGTGAYFISDSNIDFYTTEIAMALAGIMYRF